MSLIPDTVLLSFSPPPSPLFQPPSLPLSPSVPSLPSSPSPSLVSLSPLPPLFFPPSYTSLPLPLPPFIPIPPPPSLAPSILPLLDFENWVRTTVYAAIIIYRVIYYSIWYDQNM